MVANIEIVSMEFIKPSSPTPHESKDHKLSFLDQLQFPTYVPIILFYQNESLSDDTENSRRSSQHLKRSLSETLTKFYPLAGRIKGNLSVDCNDSGALFVEAQVHAELSQAIQNASTDEINRFLPLNPFNYYLKDAANHYPNDDEPLLAVQISFFECGSMAVGICLSHKIADAFSMAKFINAWANMNSSQADYHELLQPSFGLASQLFPGIDGNSRFPLHRRSKEEEKFVTKRFLFDKEKLRELKELATSSGSTLQIKNPTRVEAVSAFIWKQFISISRNKNIFAAVHFVNLRTRMIMSLPSKEFIFGNLSDFAFALSSSTSTTSTTTTTQEGNDVDQYHELVHHLRTAIKRINADHIKYVQDGVSYLNAMNKGNNTHDDESSDTCIFSSWCRFPFYEVDYGWGKPISVCTSVAPMRNTVILMSTRCGDGIEAWISMLEDEIAMLPQELLSLERTIYY